MLLSLPLFHSDDHQWRRTEQDLICCWWCWNWHRMFLLSYLLSWRVKGCLAMFVSLFSSKCSWCRNTVICCLCHKKWQIMIRDTRKRRTKWDKEKWCIFFLIPRKKMSEGRTRVWLYTFPSCNFSCFFFFPDVMTKLASPPIKHQNEDCSNCSLCDPLVKQR